MARIGGYSIDEYRKKTCGTAASRGSGAEMRLHADLHRTLVLSYIAELVQSGLAEWVALGNGDIELRLRSGEIFHLGKTAVTRIG
jgi:hypothetical protein